MNLGDRGSGNSGFFEMQKSSERGFCVVSSIIWIAFLPEKGGILSCSCTSPLANSGPIKSALVASACPNLTNPGPKACSASHKACPASFLDLRPAMIKFRISNRRQNQSGNRSIFARCPSTPARPRIKQFAATATMSADYPLIQFPARMNSGNSAR